jgi:O-antigen/teichoic acid export membrane protein
MAIINRFILLYQRGVEIVFSDVVFRRVLSNTGWVLGANGVNAIFGFLQGIFVARALGVTQYGVLGVVMTFVTVVNRLTSFRMNECVVKYVSEFLSSDRKDRAAGVIKMAVVVEAGGSLLAFCIVLMLAGLGARWFIHTPDAKALITVYAFVVLGNLVSETTNGVLQVFGQFRLQSLLILLARSISLCLIILAYMTSAGLWGILIVYLVTNIVSALLLSNAAFRETGKRLGPQWWRVPFRTLDGQWRSASKFILSTNISATLSLITKDSDLLWLGYFRNATEVGYYKLAMSLATTVFIPVAPLIQTLYPEIAREAALRNWDIFRRLLKKGSTLVALYIIPAGLFLCVLARSLIHYFYGSDFIPSADALMILYVGLAFAHLFFWNRPALLALDRPDYPMKINVLIAVLKIVGVFAIVPIFGYLGNAALLSGLYLLGVSLTVCKIYREILRRKNAECSLILTK